MKVMPSPASALRLRNCRRFSDVIMAVNVSIYVDILICPAQLETRNLRPATETTLILVAMHRLITASSVKGELIFTTSRSGGPGGQLVNKVSSKVMLRWDITNSTKVSPEEKEILLQKLKSRLTQGGVLLIVSQESRSQHDNKQAAIDKLDELLKRAFEKKKARKATRRSKSSQEKRLTSKKRESEKKQWRRKI